MSTFLSSIMHTPTIPIWAMATLEVKQKACCPSEGQDNMNHNGAHSQIPPPWILRLAAHTKVMQNGWGIKKKPERRSKPSYLSPLHPWTVTAWSKRACRIVGFREGFSEAIRWFHKHRLSIVCSIVGTGRGVVEVVGIQIKLSLYWPWTWDMTGRVSWGCHQPKMYIWYIFFWTHS